MEFSNNIQNNRENLNNNNNSLKIERIRNGVIKPKEPRENGTMGGTGPLNIDAACTSERWLQLEKWFQIILMYNKKIWWSQSNAIPFCFNN